MQHVLKSQVLWRLAKTGLRFETKLDVNVSPPSLLPTLRAQKAEKGECTLTQPCLDISSFLSLSVILGTCPCICHGDCLTHAQGHPSGVLPVPAEQLPSCGCTAGNQAFSLTGWPSCSGPHCPAVVQTPLQRVDSGCLACF